MIDEPAFFPALKRSITVSLPLSLIDCEIFSILLR
jgi:hypothetical protein